MGMDMTCATGITLACLSVSLAAAGTTGPVPKHPGAVADDALLVALRSDPARADQLALLRRIAATLAEHAHERPKLRQADANNLDAWMGRITTISLWAAVSGEAAAMEEARAWLTEAIQAPADGNNNYEYGAYAQGLGTAYDLLAPHLEDPLRAATRDHLAAVCRNLYLACRGERPGWWHGLYLHHDLWIPTAGVGVGGAALLGEVPEAKTWYEFAKAEFGKVFSFLGDDGGWTEGAAPWCYGVEALIGFCDVVERIEGKGFADRPWLASTAKYRLYMLFGPRLPLRYAVVDDSHEDGRYGNRGSAAAPLLFWLAGRYGDPQAQWLAELERQVDLNELTGRKSDRANLGTIVYTAGFGALWYNPAVPAEPPPQRVSSVLFDNIGLAVGRSGWTDADEVITFQCGPPGGHVAANHMAEHPKDPVGDSISHVHANANSITYYAAGRPWITGPGYGYRDTSFQNTVAVEAGTQTWAMRPGARILRRELADDHVYLLGDATKAWTGQAKIDRAWRHMLWLPGRGVILCDQLTTMDGDARYIRRYDWQFYHPAGLNATRQESGFRLSGSPDGHALHVDLYTNGKPRYESASLTMPNGYVRLRKEALVLAGEVPPRCWIAAAIHLEPPAPAKMTPAESPATATSQDPAATGPASKPAIVSRSASASGPGWCAVAMKSGSDTDVAVIVLDAEQFRRQPVRVAVDLHGLGPAARWWVVGLAPGSHWTAERLAADSTAAGEVALIKEGGDLEASQAGLLRIAWSAG